MLFSQAITIRHVPKHGFFESKDKVKTGLAAL
jgi:hypothetical protein